MTDILVAVLGLYALHLAIKEACFLWHLISAILEVAAHKLIGK